MKELSIEEKAYCYDEAIGKAKEMIKAMTDIGGVAKADDIQYLFPELVEDEDERIRKAMIDYFKWNPDGQLLNEFSNREVFAWLEKQGKKLADNIEKPWSEEDENNILFLTAFIEECFKDKEEITICGDTMCANFTKEDVIERLKSLRPQ